MQYKPTIVIIHPNSLCNFAIRTILTDILPFMGQSGEVEIATFNSIREFSEAHLPVVIHCFVAAGLFMQEPSAFAPYQKHTIVLVEGKEGTMLPPHIHTIDIGCAEGEMLKSLLSLLLASHAAHDMQPQASNDYAELLSSREKEVLSFIVKGYLNKEIADKLSISIPTVIFHRRNISEKLGSKSIGRMTIYAVMNGIVNLYEI